MSTEDVKNAARVINRTAAGAAKAVPAEFDTLAEFLDGMRPFFEKVLGRTDTMEMLKAKDEAGVKEWARTMAKSAKMMLTQVTGEKDNTRHAGEALFARMILASFAYRSLYKKFPNPGSPIGEIGKDGRVVREIVKAANPAMWRAVQEWIEGILTYAKVTK